MFLCAYRTFVVLESCAFPILQLMYFANQAGSTENLSQFGQLFSAGSWMSLLHSQIFRRFVSTLGSLLYDQIHTSPQSWRIQLK